MKNIILQFRLWWLLKCKNLHNYYSPSFVNSEDVFLLNFYHFFRMFSPLMMQESGMTKPNVHGEFEIPVDVSADIFKALLVMWQYLSITRFISGEMWIIAISTSCIDQGYGVWVSVISKVGIDVTEMLLRPCSRELWKYILYWVESEFGKRLLLQLLWSIYNEAKLAILSIFGFLSRKY